MYGTTQPYRGYTPQAAPGRPNSLFAIGGMGNAYLAFAAITTSLVFYAFIADLMGPAGESVRLGAIVVAAALAVTGAAICLWRGLLLPAFVSVAGLLSIFTSLYVFSMNSGVPFTFNSGGEYVGIGFTGLFALTLQDRTYGRLMRWFFYLCCIYVVFYVAASLALRLGLVGTGGVSRAIASADDAGRGDRLHAAALLMVYGTAYSVLRVRSDFRMIYLAWAIMFLVGWFLTGSRTIVVVIIPVLLAYLVWKNPKALGKLGFLAFMTGIVLSMMIIINPELNPFLYFGDQSASVRTNSIDIASQKIGDFLITGAGISFGIENYKPISGITYFFPGDIGMIGIFFVYGLPGLLLYILICYLGCTSYARIVAKGYSSDIATSVMLTAVILSLYSLQAPMFNGGSSGVLFATMFIALALDKTAIGRASQRRAGTPSGVHPSSGNFYRLRR
ncbi:O-antigen ligase family protein [Blastomonas sp.]|uniref:O-antigen ligase family protein n=1 Tax=Blastomonas sp. TaxID=1909299 RepID=UPI00391A9D2D